MIALPGEVSVAVVYAGAVYDRVVTRWVRCRVCHKPLEPRDFCAGFSVCDDCPIE
jgi:hypothetical protein